MIQSLEILVAGSQGVMVTKNDGVVIVVLKGKKKRRKKKGGLTSIAEHSPFCFV